MKKEHGVYKFVEKKTGKIIYIGKSNTSIDNRIFAHLAGKGIDEKFKKYKNKCDIFTAILPNSVETDIVERCLINKYKPELNVVDNQDGLSNYIQITELRWEIWDIKKKKEQRNISRDPFYNMIQALTADDIAEMLLAIQLEECRNNELKVLREYPVIQISNNGATHITDYGKKYIELLAKSKLCNLYKLLRIRGIPEEDINPYNYAQLIQYLLDLELKVTSPDKNTRYITIKRKKPIIEDDRIWLFECKNILGYRGDAFISKNFKDGSWQDGKKSKKIIFHNRNEAIEFFIEIDDLCRKYATKQKDLFHLDAKYLYNSKSYVVKRLTQKGYLTQICIYAQKMSSCLFPKLYGHKEKITDVFIDRSAVSFLFLGLQAQLQKEKSEEIYAEYFY